MKSKEFLKIIGERQRTLTHWTENGLLLPSVNAAGAGYPSEYNKRCVLEARLIRELYEAGFGKHKIKQIMQETRGEILPEMKLKLTDNITIICRQRTTANG